MAYMTEDRFGTIQAKPIPTKTAFVLVDDAQIFAHTLVGINGDGKATNITDGNKGDLVAIGYTTVRLQRYIRGEGYPTPRMHQSQPYPATADVLSNITVHFETDGSIAIGDEGSDVYLVDDHTVTLNDAGDGSTPFVGKLQKVITEDIVVVHIPGLYPNASV